MSSIRLIVVAFVGMVFVVASAMVFLLDWRASKATGRSLRGSLTLVPSEAQRLFMDVKRSHPVEATKTEFDKVAARL